VLAVRRYPAARFFGLDISAAMLQTAAAALARESLAGRVKLAQGDATDFDGLALFGRNHFDCVVISYALSMIPGWQATINRALQSLAPAGSLHIVDFGQQERLPPWFGSLLRGWLAKFHVSPCADLHAELARQANSSGMSLEFAPLYRGYAVHAVVRRPSSPIQFVPRE
jgi:S-adenosylmethionine-diacylgycerolhomoserine-N-methlytransferase